LVSSGYFYAKKPTQQTKEKIQKIPFQSRIEKSLQKTTSENT
jgi:hypothetical protein